MRRTFQLLFFLSKILSISGTRSYLLHLDPFHCVFYEVPCENEDASPGGARGYSQQTERNLISLRPSSVQRAAGPSYRLERSTANTLRLSSISLT